MTKQVLDQAQDKITLTEEGEYIYKKLAPSFDDIEKTVSNIVENKIVPKPKIKIATIPSAASIYIPNLLKKIRIEFPEVEVDLQETTSARAVKLVKRSNEADIKRIMAVYFEQNVTTDEFEESDGERWVIFGE